jgi:GMP synthase (glutamine-hydrolysing)
MISDHKNTIVIVNAGGQYCHLIARRVREAGVRSIICGVDITAEELSNAKGIIISGGPSSVYEANAPRFSDAIFQSKLPLLGLCYGHQYLANALGGKVAPGEHHEYGEAVLNIVGFDTILQGLGKNEKVWMSHGDEVTMPPPGFQVLARTSTCPIAVMADLSRNIFGIQFHPEVNETECGRKIIDNFLFKICECERDWHVDDVIDLLRKKILREVGSRRVLFFVSGGVDSTVAFTLCTEVLGPERVTGIFVNTGFMRKGEQEEIETAFGERGWHNMRYLDATKSFLPPLDGVDDPEEKRQIIGNCFLALQEELEAHFKLENESWLLGQGTIYPDTIESGGGKNAAVIKTHHNRVPAVQKLIEAGLILEPLRDFYKDEVREVGRILGLPEALVFKHPFPGPGLAVRCLCSAAEYEVIQTKELKEITNGTKMCAWSVPLRTVGVQGDYRSYSNLVILGGDENLAGYASIARRITREIRKTNRVAFLVSGGEENGLARAFVSKKFITKERLDLLREADALSHRLLKESGLMNEVWQFPVVLLPLTVGGGETIALRPVASADAMTAKHANLPLEFIQNLGDRILEIPGVDMVLYDVTDKPPATIEWE